ncbi:hypothetical protein Tco_1131710 [Tanacetum coccineum]|uniref:CCHC-type domain-containing protein n=1 Tax=Tanacetum coccineum TaxID=301880 RepID=A0ABQ5JE14_9ASTR
MSSRSTIWGQAKKSRMVWIFAQFVNVFLLHHECPIFTQCPEPRSETRAAPKGNFECGAPGHFKRDCLKLKNKDGGNRNAQEAQIEALKPENLENEDVGGMIRKDIPKEKLEPRIDGTLCINGRKTTEKIVLIQAEDEGCSGVRQKSLTLILSKRRLSSKLGIRVMLQGLTLERGSYEIRKTGKAEPKICRPFKVVLAKDWEKFAYKLELPKS